MLHLAKGYYSGTDTVNYASVSCTSYCSTSNSEHQPLACNGDYQLLATDSSTLQRSVNLTATIIGTSRCTKFSLSITLMFKVCLSQQLLHNPEAVIHMLGSITAIFCCLCSCPCHYLLYFETIRFLWKKSFYLTMTSFVAIETDVAEGWPFTNAVLSLRVHLIHCLIMLPALNTSCLKLT